MSSRRPLRVTFVINGLGTGGAERSLADMLPLYLEGDIEPRVVCLFRRMEGVHDAVEQMGVSITVLRSRSVVGRSRELAESLHSAPCDLVATAIFEADLVGRLSARRAGVPVLTSLVNTSYDQSRLADPRIRHWKLEALRRFEGVTARRMTAHFHAITEAVKAASIDSLGLRPDTITVVPRGRDPRRLGRRTPERRSAVRAMLEIEESTPTILAVGRQEYQKGHVRLIDAMARVRSVRPEARLFLAGRKGAMSHEIENQIQDLGLAEYVHILGHRDDIPDLMAAADVLAFPSLYEGLGGTLIEALALELPIVATDIPAIREVTDSGKCATLVQPASTDDLTHALLGVLDDPVSLQHQVGAGRQRFEREYTTDSVGTEMVRLMRNVARVE